MVSYFKVIVELWCRINDIKKRKNQETPSFLQKKNYLMRKKAILMFSIGHFIDHVQASSDLKTKWNKLELENCTQNLISKWFSEFVDARRFRFNRFGNKWALVFDLNQFSIEWKADEYKLKRLTNKSELSKLLKELVELNENSNWVENRWFEFEMLGIVGECQKICFRFARSYVRAGYVIKRYKLFEGECLKCVQHLIRIIASVRYYIIGRISGFDQKLCGFSSYPANASSNQNELISEFIPKKKPCGTTFKHLSQYVARNFLFVADFVFVVVVSFDQIRAPNSHSWNVQQHFISRNSQ